MEAAPRRVGLQTQSALSFASPFRRLAFFSHPPCPIWTSCRPRLTYGSAGVGWLVWMVGDGDGGESSISKQCFLSFARPGNAVNNAQPLNMCQKLRPYHVFADPRPSPIQIEMSEKCQKLRPNHILHGSGVSHSVSLFAKTEAKSYF